MSSFGVQPEGFVQKSRSAVLNGIEQSEQDAFGTGFNVEADSTAGQLNGVMADELAELWEVAGAVYRANQAQFSTDASLDALADLTGAERLAAAPSTTTVNLNIDNATTVPSGSLMTIGANGAAWETKAALTNSTGFNATLSVAAESVDDAPIPGNAGAIDTISTPVSGWSAKAATTSLSSGPYAFSDGITLTIEVDGTNQTVTFNTGDFAVISAATATEVASVLTTRMTGVTGADLGGFVRITSDTDGTGSSLKVISGAAIDFLGLAQNKIIGFNPDTNAQTIAGTSETYALSNNETLTLKVDQGVLQVITFVTADFADIANATVQEVVLKINQTLTGALAYDVNGKIQIESRTSGLNSQIEITGGAANDAFGFPEEAFGGTEGAATLGRDLETDPPFRTRRRNTVQAGTDTVGAIFSAITKVTNVTEVVVFENDTNATDADGLPAHSFEAVVAGGLDQDILDAILSAKPIGITAFGLPGPDQVSGTSIDSQGEAHTIQFSRRTKVRLFVEVDVSVDSTFGGGDQIVGEAQIKNVIRDFGLTLTTGEDITINKFLCLPFDVTGVTDSLDIKIDTIASPVNTDNIVIQIREIATFDTEDMVVNFV